MLELNVGRILELHELLVLDKAFFERGEHELTKAGKGHIALQPDEFARLRNAVAEVAEIAKTLNLSATEIAASRTQQVLDNVGAPPPGAYVAMQRDHCRTMFRHLMDIVSRIRDDCGPRKYFQIAPENAGLLKSDADHFGPEVTKAFGGATGDIAEAASCLALERPTACCFHLMRALEVVAAVIAKKIGATVVDAHGKGLPWGVIASNMKPIIDKMPKGSDEQIKWYRVHAFLEVVNRAWRAPTAHPKETYTPEEAKKVFEATKAFMQELAPLA